MLKKITFLFTFLLLTTCSLFSQSFLSVDYLGSRTPGELAAQFFNLTTFEYNVDFYRVTYESVDLDGNTVTVSGLLIIPNDPTRVFPVACYMHGTSGSNQDVPSQLGLDADLPIALAAKGYVTVAPDYLGLGVHEGVHPFVHAESEAWVGVDMIRALRNYAVGQDFYIHDQLFLTGYSQGGHAAMALHREIESNLSGEFTVTAATHMSGPYSIAEVMRDLILSEEEYSRPGYLINTMVSYQYVYGNVYANVSEAFKPPYQQLVQDYTEEQISLEILDTQLADLLEANEGAVIPVRALNEDFVQAFTDDPDHPVNVALEDNNVYDWAPVAPTRLYYCEADEQIPFENALVAEAAMIGNGASDVMAASVNALFSHALCAFPASIATADFFEIYQMIEAVPVSTYEILAGQLQLSPNPADDFTTISDLPASGIMKLYDLSGKMLETQPMAVGRNIVRTDALSPGMYMLEVVCDHIVYSEKLIVH